MSRSRDLLLPPVRDGHQPTAEEVALRPELVKHMLSVVSSHVDSHDIEHMVCVGITSDGTPRLYHSYGRDLPLHEAARLLQDIATVAQLQADECLKTKQ